MLLTSNDLVKKAKLRITEIPDNVFLADKDRFVLIDVREKNEVDGGIIEGATHIPRGTLEMNIHKHLKEVTGSDYIDNVAIALYCRSGARSALAAESLQQMGFEDVYSLRGGITQWKDDGYPLVNVIN
ncbi:rhodanese [Veronia nyctiphanis]|uniref:Rhodanese n=1 Tax=Veronia nyctiphanis TaxID=1278244 RepID=A0A4Q0YRY7_9GAMM|nr:rhodanese-like domain-containing protein [Veronia nyctiphanis]RXJ71721.1 rhodanese [Veronia nyctiphanis]